MPPLPPQYTGPKRQHYLPRFYLEGFTENSGFTVFDRETAEYRQQTPVNTGLESHLYTFEDEEGKKRYDLEAILSKIETDAKIAIEILVEGGELSDEQRANLSLFVGYMATRVPSSIDRIKGFLSEISDKISQVSFANQERARQAIRQYSEDPDTEETYTKSEIEQYATEMVEFVRSGNYEVNADHQYSVGLSLGPAATIAQLLYERNWWIGHRHSPSKSFVTCDNPVGLTTV